MEIRGATIKDGQAIHELISFYAELDKMLFRSLSDIYENIPIFLVAEDKGQVVGCCALQIIWKDLAEVKSLAVSKNCMGRGVGRALVEASLARAAEYGVDKVFALTLEPYFFEKIGFQRVNRQDLPMKVWSDCARCPKQDECDEIALIYKFG